MLPVFGEKCNDAGFVAMIEDGDALASVTTNLKSGQPFSSVYASFKVAEAASIDAGFADAQASTNVPMVQPVMYTGKLTVRYALLGRGGCLSGRHEPRGAGALSGNRSAAGRQNRYSGDSAQPRADRQCG